MVYLFKYGIEMNFFLYNNRKVYKVELKKDVLEWIMGILMFLMWCKSLRIWILNVGYEFFCDGGGGNVI